MSSELSPTLGGLASDYSASPSSGSQRRERGAIAAQACDTCRSRKQKCDEQRPTCGTCQKFGLECNYRQPQPTKKDKTLAEILNRIKSLEGKIDDLSMRALFPATTVSTVSTAGTSASSGPVTFGQAGPLGNPIYHVPPGTSNTVPQSEDHYKYVPSVHQMLGWPILQQVLDSIQPKTGVDFSNVARDGPAMLLGLRENSQRLRLEADGAHAHDLPHGLPMEGEGATSFTIPSLTWDSMQRLCNAYFDTFNMIYPILDRQSFLSETMTSIVSDGFNEGMASTLALLIAALGEVAIAAVHGVPIHMSNGRPSGIKGGTATRPPGLSLFNEARKRMGFNLADCSLENVQVFALAGLYYGTACCHMECWRMTISASLACRALVMSNPAELSSPRGDLVRRIFWHCLIMETALHLELGLPLTGLETLEHVVGLPDFSGPFSHEDYLGNEGSHFQEHFASQIVLRRLVVDFHNILGQEPSTTASTPFTPSGSPTPPTAVNPATIKRFALQLDQWHGMLPASLRWPEDSPGAFPGSPPVNPTYDEPSNTTTKSTETTTTTTTTTTTAPLMFTTDLDAPPTAYPYGLDIQAALLRSRYYHAKYLIHRPFLYKALHHPDALTADDAAGAATCLRAALRWPVTMSPAHSRKRLLPCLFFWTQNALGVLVVLHLSTSSPALARVRAALCGDRFEFEARETVGLCIDWVRDLGAADGATGWAWEVVRALYGLDEV